MRDDKNLALIMRRQKKSYSEISKKLDIPKSTLVYWFKNKRWSIRIKKCLAKKNRVFIAKQIRVMNEARKIKRLKYYAEVRKKAKLEFASLKNKQLFLAGLMLYWGEGDNKLENSIVRLSNTNPKMIKIFSLFLRSICRVDKEKLRIALILYHDLGANECKEFWSKISGVPKDKFHKI